MKELEEARRKLRLKWYELNRCMQHLGLGEKRSRDWGYWDEELSRRRDELRREEKEHEAFLREYAKHEGEPWWEEEKRRRGRELHHKRLLIAGARRAGVYAKSEILKEARTARNIMGISFADEIRLLRIAEMWEGLKELRYIEDRLSSARRHIDVERIIAERDPKVVASFFDTASREVNALRKLLDSLIRRLDEILS